VVLEAVLAQWYWRLCWYSGTEGCAGTVVLEAVLAQWY